MSAARLAKAAIKIPMRIERGPTDILRALAATVKHIPGQPEAFLQDDPYLLPEKYNDKRSFLAAKLSGKKTAKYILNKHPQYFYRDDAEPKVEAFHPPEEFRPDMELTEADIVWCLEHNDCPNALIAYNAMTEKGVEPSNETLLQFFEMLCYTNEESLKDFFEYETSRLITNSEAHLVNMTWKTNGLAEKIFNKIKDNTDPPRVYSAMIAGLCKFNEFATANQIFEDFSVNNPKVGLYQSAYDGLLNGVPRLNSSVATVHKAVAKIVEHMENNLVKPSLQSFNSILNAYSRVDIDQGTCVKSLRLINDMKALNILPSLATYAYLTRIIAGYKRGIEYGYLVAEMIAHIESEAEFLIVKDDRDANFLQTIMYVIAFRLHNLQLAKRLHRIYLKNPNLFSDHKIRVSYLNAYFKLMITTDSLENVLDFYNDYVPLHFQPQPDTYEALGDILELYEADEKIIKKIGEDIIKFRLNDFVKKDAVFCKDPDYCMRSQQASMDLIK